MKKLYIVRHAKSDLVTGSDSDFDRPLNPRGNDDAIRMSSFIRSKGLMPELILTSPALRSISTARFIAEASGYGSIPLNAIASLYLTDIQNTLKILGEVDDKIASVMIVGHNPAQTLLVNYLTDEILDQLPTCGLAAIDFPFAKSWREIARSTGSLSGLFFL